MTDSIYGFSESICNKNSIKNSEPSISAIDSPNFEVVEDDDSNLAETSAEDLMEETYINKGINEFVLSF